MAFTLRRVARALMRRTEKGKHYGIVTAKFVDVLRALLWGFHNAASGKCFPSYEAIAEAAACSRTHGLQRHQGARAAWDSDVGQSHQARARVHARLVRQGERLALARGAHVQRLRLHRPAGF